MTLPPSPYASPPPLRSSLFRNPPEQGVPPTDELESLHSEMKILKQRTLERAKKAGDDLRYIEESMRRIKEREKGKAKAVVEKVKKERDFTPLPVEEPKLPIAVPAALSRPRIASGTPIPSTSSKPPAPLLDPRKSKLLDDSKKKKKKRKREFGDSDEERDSQRTRKVSPSPSVHIHPHKALKAPPSFPHAKPPTGPDFTVPQSISVPKRPAVPPPPIPGPSKQTEVTEDFSNSKAPTQTLVTTFYSSIEPWLRPIKEEDLGFLEHTGDEVEPYIMPKLGRHYSEIWEEEDIAYYGTPLTDVAALRSNQASRSSPSGKLPKWDPSSLNEIDLLTEEKGHGPLTERLVSALLPIPDSTVWKGVKAAEDAMEGRPGITGAAFAAAKEKVNVADLEERIKDSARFHGLLKNKPDYSDAIDDPISAALRQSQRQLRTVVATNKARKSRLAAVARDRLGYQEYVDLRDSIDKNITTLYSKSQKKDAPKVSKKKKKAGESNGNANTNGNGNSGTPVLPVHNAALGLAPDEEDRLNVPEQLKQLVHTRRQWVDAVGAVFDQKEQESPGRVYGIPRKSLFEGLEEDIRRDALDRLNGPSTSDIRTKKGKEKARGDEMEVD